VIEVTRLNGSRVFVNADHIRRAEANPDTAITFTDGAVMVVQESPAEIAAKVIALRAQIIRQANSQAPAEV
jgi:flagellar protein FlbD